MKILITGAGGNLGRAVIGPLLAGGHTLRLADTRAIAVPAGAEFITADVRDAAAMRKAVAGVDTVIHAAALHGVHLAKWSPADFWAINVTGTFNVYEAAREARVKRVVLCSTMGVYGEGAKPPADAWAIVDESTPLLPGDIYGTTKVLCEELAQFYARRHGITSVALRLGMFVPESTFEQYGFRLLYGGVDDRDVAQAVIQSLTHAPPANGFAAYDIMAPTPFTRDDVKALHADAAAVFERYFPGYAARIARGGFDAKLHRWGPQRWPVDRAIADLGYRPQYDFARFLDAAERGDRSLYPELGLPWWGV